MGSRTRFDYTMMGDNVNLASRMESGAKTWGVFAMCTDTTKAACEKHGGDRVVFRPLGRIQVMGRVQPVSIFELVGLREDLPASVGDCLALFNRALGRYYARDWAGAIAGFQLSAAVEPNQPNRMASVKTNPSLVFLEFAQRQLDSPPPPDWDGTYIMTEK